MILNSNKQISIKLLIIYMISALLFLSSIELHIHTHKAAATADHGSAVSITSLPDSLVSAEEAQEIEVSPDGMLHAHASTPNILALFILLTILVAVLQQIFIRPIESTRNTLVLPFFGTPSLRAPPQ